ncbi:hypothetical protein BASA81_004765 [Batrachochytrium salamandrivorans]|nr:hypothetical protein BASA81_004765 [Batrachochytrium salamandrivorans]
MSNKTAGPTTEKRRQDELDWEDEREEEDRSNAPRACEAFEVDLAAREFGTCKCGFKKQDHIQGYRAGPRAITQPSAFSHDPTPRRASVGSETEDVSSSATVAACDAYVIDMSAQEFGTCKCGQKKTAHTKQAIFAKPKTSGGFATLQAQADRDKEDKIRDQERERKRKEEEQKAHAEFLERERKINGSEYVVSAPVAAVVVVEEVVEDLPLCAAYELDLQAAKFGTCKCGQAKTAHTREALNAKPQHSSGVHRASVTAHEEDDSVEESGPKACDAFELDMSAAEFGTCKCGFKKTLHSKDALFAKPPTSRPSKPAPAFTQVAAKVTPPAAPKVVAAPVAVAPPSAPVHYEPEPTIQEAEQHGGEVLDPPHVYRALFDFEGQEAEDLPFREGDLIEVVEVIDQDWLRGRIGSTIGVFPRDYAELYQEAVEEEPVAVVEQEVQQHYEEPQPIAEPTYEEPVTTVIAAAEGSEFPFVVYAQFDFESENEGDLALRTGDAVTVLEYVDEQWWRGQVNGNEGIFPADFVAKDQPPHEDPAVPAAVQEDAGLGFVIAQFDFQAENEGDLSFNQGDRIQVLELIDENWMRGALNGNEGILPVSYVGEVTH